jgi:hypothetical protein
MRVAVALFATAVAALAAASGIRSVPLFVVGGPLRPEWRLSPEAAHEYLLVAGLCDGSSGGGSLRADVVAVAAAAAAAAGPVRAQALVAEHDLERGRLPCFMEVAFLARLLGNRLAATRQDAPHAWEELAVSVMAAAAAPNGSEGYAAPDGLAGDAASALLDARLHVPAPFAAGVFGDSGSRVALAEAVSHVSVAVALPRAATGERAGPSPPTVLDARAGCDGDVCAAFRAASAMLERDAARVSFDFPGAATAGLARLAVDDADRTYAERVAATDAGADPLAAHAAALQTAEAELTVALGGSADLLAIALGELSGRAGVRLTSASLERRLRRARMCDGAAREAEAGFARLAARPPYGGPLADGLLEAAGASALRRVAAASPADPARCPLGSEDFVVSVYARVSAALRDDAEALREATLEASAELALRYRSLVGRASRGDDQRRPPCRTELAAVHERALANCVAAYDGRFGALGDSAAVAARRAEMLAEVAAAWERTSRRNDEAVAGFCRDEAGRLARRYAALADAVASQLEEGDAAARAGDKMAAAAADLYGALTAKYAADSAACRDAGAGMRAAVARARGAAARADAEDAGRLARNAARGAAEAALMFLAVVEMQAYGVVFGLAGGAIATAALCIGCRRRRPA